ncbi:hypothetical protein IGI04_010733 [Brassica rapa subsp. trilocularis]|uniref:Uncharacterized protein n=1 Tax=Brassica rapa subsp. trilocularis TaxID=1813537 RepID=A0ABQ7N103_BRACM|nr:hypothetical protein IGI04_010733 [Brassica rapa subsp. trilocularis]
MTEFPSSIEREVASSLLLLLSSDPILFSTPSSDRSGSEEGNRSLCDEIDGKASMSFVSKRSCDSAISNSGSSYRKRSEDDFMNFKVRSYRFRDSLGVGLVCDDGCVLGTDYVLGFLIRLLVCDDGCVLGTDYVLGFLIGLLYMQIARKRRTNVVYSSVDSKLVTHSKNLEIDDLSKEESCLSGAGGKHQPFIYKIKSSEFELSASPERPVKRLGVSETHNLFDFNRW